MSKTFPETAAKGSDLKELVKQLAKEQQKRADWERAYHDISQSASFRLGHVLALSFKSLRGVLGLPVRLAREARDIYKLRKKDRSAPASRPRYSSSPVNYVNLGGDTDWIELPVKPGERVSIEGSLWFKTPNPAARKTALFSGQFVSKSGAAQTFDPGSSLTWLPQKQIAQGYIIRQEPSYSFALGLIVPDGAIRLRIGLKGWQLRNGFARIETRRDSDRLVSPHGLLALGETELGAAHAHLSEAEREALPKLITVTDQFTAECLAPDTRSIRIKKTDWDAEFHAHENAVAFFAESAWRGNDESWNYAMTKPEKWGRELSDLITACKDKDIPTLFWNKEDPVNFDTFIETARQFDHVFTTDADCVPAYEAHVGKGHAHVMMFAAQPALHNPIRQGARQNRVAFTGSWRGLKYPKRAEWLELLLTPAMERGVLDIYDRFADEKENPDLIFPQRFQPALRGALAYGDLVQSVYKTYDAFVNVNSVESSDTMLARRVFEIMGCGAPVVSSYSPAMEKQFGDLVLMPRTEQETGEVFDKLLGDDLYRASLATRGVRLIHSRHTYRHRLQEMSAIIGTPFVAKPARKVSILCSSKRPEFLPDVGRLIRAQTYAESEMIFVMHRDDMTEDQVERALHGVRNLKIIRMAEDRFLAHALNEAMQIAEGDTFAKWDDDDLYGPNYLLDSLLAFDYAPQATVIGKNSYFTYLQSRDATYLRFPGKDNQLTNLVHGGTLIWDRKSAEGLKFPIQRQGTDTAFLQALQAQGRQILSTNQFNFVHMRYANLEQHTWKIRDDAYLEGKTILMHQGRPDARVFV
ncbi:glycosyltransferase family protein [Celeribacter sp. ULVN23_4]